MKAFTSFKKFILTLLKIIVLIFLSPIAFTALALLCVFGALLIMTMQGYATIGLLITSLGLLLTLSSLLLIVIVAMFKKKKRTPVVISKESGEKTNDN